MNMLKTLRSKEGLTLVEVLIAASIFAFCLAGLLLTYMNLLIQTDISRDTTIANNMLQAKLEELKTAGYANIAAMNNTTFNVVDQNFLVGGNPMVIGKGLIEVSNVSDPFVNSTYTDLEQVRVVISFKSRSRVVGEDANLNGRYDNGEYQSGYPNDGKLHSPIEGILLIKNFTNSTS